jgi:CspA family cold shock protein
LRSQKSTWPPGPLGGFLLAAWPDRRSTIAIVIARESADVASGTVKWFNATKGYGFIAPDGGGKDVFVHISAVEKAGYDGLPDGAKVTYDVISDRGKESAGNLRLK